MIFPIRLHLRDPHTPAHIALKAQLYVCSTLCTSNQLTLNADVPPGFQSAEIKSLIDGWRAKVPRDKSGSISIRSVRLEPGAQPHVHVEVSADPPLGKPDAFVDGDDAVVAHRPIVKLGAESASIDLPLDALTPGHPNKPLHVTIVDRERSIQAALPIEEPSTGKPVNTFTELRIASSSLGHVLGLALLGGFILNFMPCVFPVLSLKVFSLVGTQTRSAASIRIRFLASAAGVIGPFVLLAIALIILKTAGAQIGWGIQFQQPIFLIFMVGVLAALGGNLLGVYELRLPSRLANSLDGAASGPSIPSYFVNGLVMTLLATPCSAPFGR